MVIIARGEIALVATMDRMTCGRISVDTKSLIFILDRIAVALVQISIHVLVICTDGASTRVISN